MDQTSHLNVTGLGKSYDKKMVLQSINLEFRAGQFVALVGRNGSGKSTLMKLISQRERFDQGDIIINGKTLKDPTNPSLSKIFFLTEDLSIPPRNSLKWWSKVFQKTFHDYDLACFERLVLDLSIEPEKTLSEMSRGQKAKSLFALYAARKPKLYLLDEITSVLDSGSRWALMRFLEEERSKGALIIMSTNIASEMQGFANQVCVLDNGQLVLNIKTSELGHFFEKRRWKSDDEKDIAQLESEGFKATSTNTDGSISLLRHKNGRDENISSDRREVSIEDVVIFYTSKGGNL